MVLPTHAANLDAPFKLVVNTDRGEWSNLARGTALLLYSRGVDRYTNPFDRAMLESQLTYVVCAPPLTQSLPSDMLTASHLGTVWSIYEVQGTLFPALTRMERPPVANHYLAFPDITIAILDITVSALRYHN